MYQLIQAYLAQHKKVQLAPLGELCLEEQPLSWHAVDAQLAHNGYELSINKNNFPTETGLVHYISSNAKVTLAEAEQMLATISQQPVINFDNLGLTLHKTSEGYIVNGNLVGNDILQPVPAAKVIRKEHTHSIIVGEQQHTNTEMEAFYAGEVSRPPSDKWWLAALLIALGIVAYAVYYFVIQKGSF